MPAKTARTAKPASGRTRTARATYARLSGRSASSKPAARKAPAGLPIDREIQGIVRDYAFGDIWSRPGLPLQTRSLITIAMLTALYRTDQLRIHINFALNLRIKPEQILETILHAGAYAGLPCGANARQVANEVFLKRGVIKEPA